MWLFPWRTRRIVTTIVLIVRKHGVPARTAKACDQLLALDTSQLRQRQLNEQTLLPFEVTFSVDSDVLTFVALWAYRGNNHRCHVLGRLASIHASIAGFASPITH
jgi:hypothetical protein